MTNFTATIETLVRELEALEKSRDPSFRWPEAGLLVALRKAWATYDYEKHAWTFTSNPRLEPRVFCQICRHEAPGHHPGCPVLTGEPQRGNP